MKGKYAGNNEMLQHLIESSPVDDYDGRSTKEIHYLIYDPFCDKSPLLLQKVSNAKLFHVPILNLTKFFLELLKELNHIKLNSKGLLPLKVIRTILAQDFFVEENDFISETSFTKHSEVPLIKNIVKLAEISGLISIENHDIFLTEKGSHFKRNASNYALFVELFRAFTQKLSWSANDNYGDNNVGQFGSAFTLDLISKYGDIPRNVNFYNDKYYRAFANLLNSLSKDDTSFTRDVFYKCYVLRSFIRFLQIFGLITIIYDSNAPDLDFSIVKSNIFDSLFKFE